MTAILYLNPSWRREDGGKLRLWLPNAETPQENASQHENSSSQGAYSTQPESPIARFPSDGPPHLPRDLNIHANGIGRENGSHFGQLNGHSDGYLNGHSNGHLNGHTNGYLNGHTNVTRDMRDREIRENVIGASDTSGSGRDLGSGSLSESQLGRVSNPRSIESQDQRGNDLTNLGEIHGNNLDHQQGADSHQFPNQNY